MDTQTKYLSFLPSGCHILRARCMINTMCIIDTSTLFNLFGNEMINSILNWTHICRLQHRIWSMWLNIEWMWGEEKSAHHFSHSNVAIDSINKFPSFITLKRYETTINLLNVRLLMYIVSFIRSTLSLHIKPTLTGYTEWNCSVVYWYHCFLSGFDRNCNQTYLDSYICWN